MAVTRPAVMVFWQPASLLFIYIFDKALEGFTLIFSHRTQRDISWWEVQRAGEPAYMHCSPATWETRYLKTGCYLRYWILYYIYYCMRKYANFKWVITEKTDDAHPDYLGAAQLNKNYGGIFFEKETQQNIIIFTLRYNGVDIQSGIACPCYNVHGG